MNPLRLGIIGGSIRSAVGRVHQIAATMDNVFKVVAGCYSRDPATNYDSAREYHTDVHTITSLLNDVCMDAVTVLTPTPSHYGIVRQCQQAGIPVICEKALASTAQQAAELCGKGFLAVTFNYSGYPMIRHLRQMIDEGQLGRINFINAEMPQEGYIRGDYNAPQPWRLLDGPIPTVYLDLGVHLHHLIGTLTGLRPLSVCGSQANYGRYRNIIDHVTAQVQYEEGMSASLWFGKTALGQRNGLRIQVYGSRGSAEWVQEDPEHLQFCDARGRKQILDRASPGATFPDLSRFKAGHPSGFIEAFANLYRDIGNALRQYQSTGAWQSTEVKGGEFATEGLAMMEAITLSSYHRKEQLVKVWHE